MYVKSLQADTPHSLGVRLAGLFYFRMAAAGTAMTRREPSRVYRLR